MIVAMEDNQIIVEQPVDNINKDNRNEEEAVTTEKLYNRDHCAVQHLDWKIETRETPGFVLSSDTPRFDFDHGTDITSKSKSDFDHGTDITSKSKSGVSMSKPKPGVLRPSLRGLLLLTASEAAGSENVLKIPPDSKALLSSPHLASHVSGTWEGRWGMDDSAFEPGGILSPFAYTAVSVDGIKNKLGIPNLKLSGYFMLGSAIPGQSSTRHEENDVLFEFIDSSVDGILKVVGSGQNQFGSFTLDGTYDAASGELKCYRTYVLRSGRKSSGRKSTTGEKTRTVRSDTPRVKRPSGKQVAAQPLENVAPSESIDVPELTKRESFQSQISGVVRDRPGRVRRAPSHLLEDEDSDSPLSVMMKLVNNLISNDKEGWFIRPVDAEALGIPNYHTVIKKPMDLGTIKERLENSVYISQEEVISDIRLTFNNAMTFNPVGHPVHRVAAQHLKLFEAELRRVSRPPAKPKSITKKKSIEKPAAVGKENEKEKDKSSVAGSSTKGRRKRPLPSNTTSTKASSVKKTIKHNIFSSSDEHEDASDDSDTFERERKKVRAEKKKAKREVPKERESEEMRMLRKQVEMMNKQIEMMQQMQQASMFSIMAMNNGAQNGQPVVPAAQKPAQPKKRDVRPLSYQEKRQLGQDIHKLPGDMIQGVINIIQESGHPLGGDGDEVELDIEALDTIALKKLQKYVRKCLTKARSQKSLEDIDSMMAD